jgi:hypothetical protein
VSSYRDLLDAIARVGAATHNPHAWKDGLTGADVAVACSPMSPPGAIEAVLAKLTAAHPSVFAPAAAGPLLSAEGATAEAIHRAESLLARQRSDVAQLDLQVLTAIANAHVTATEGLAQLSQLQREIEIAVAARTDLDTPAGARELQRFLIGKMRDIRDVVEHAGLDADSKAMLAEALIGLYASSVPEAPGPPFPGPTEKPSSTAPAEREPVAAGPPDADAGPPPPAPAIDDVSAAAPDDLWTDFPEADATPIAAPPTAAAVTPAIPMMPPVAGTMPASAPFGGLGTPLGGGLPSPPFGTPSLAGSPWPDLSPAGLRATDHVGHDLPDTDGSPADPDGPPDKTDPAAEERPSPAEVASEPTPVLLPDGQTVVAPSPQLASVITAAVAGAPIPTAFSWQGITIPPPGSPVSAPVDPARLIPGDIAVLADRHALALGDGRVLLDQKIQPTSSVMGPGFIGWQHPPQPDPMNSPPVLPAPDRSAATAPS